WVDVAAPGTLIWSTNKNGSYSGTNNGTSLAAPFVAGLAGLLLAASPGLTPAQIKDKIVTLADDIDSLQEAAYVGKLGSGRINAYRTVAGLLADIDSPATGTYVSGEVTFIGSVMGWDFSVYTLEAYQDDVLIENIATSTSTVESNTLGVWDTTGYSGIFDVKLIAISPAGYQVESTVTLKVDNNVPTIEVTSPVNGASVQGAVTVLGTVIDQPFFKSYTLEYGAGSSPASYEKVINQPGSEDYFLQVTDGILATWETAGLEGDYTLRLSAYDYAGNMATQSLVVTVLASPLSSKSTQALAADLPLTFTLPNPFNLSTDSSITFNYSLSGNFVTKIYLFDLTGNLVWHKTYLAGVNGGKSGTNNPSWNGQNLFGGQVTNGIYLYQIVTDSSVIGKGKIIVLN
ncbi:MAG: S8 family serine peptidase, partial [bacterium]